MIVADSSVWIGLLGDKQSKQVEALYAALGTIPVLVPDLVVTEVLQGCDSDREFNRVRTILAAFPHVSTTGTKLAVVAAQNYRALRARGITVRKTIDTLIATRCIVDDLPLLFSDRDFEPFVEHLGLRDAMAEAR